MSKIQHGFTLIEVLLALAIIAIALTALLKATGQNIENTERLKDKTISHWVATQSLTMIQLNIVDVNQSQESTQATTMLGKKWYWRARVTNTRVPNMQQVAILVSSAQNGPFREELLGYRYLL